VYAVGDVIGFPALASTSMEQGRQAIRHAFGVAGPRARMADLPFAIYTIPEVSFLGETEEAVRVRGAAYRVGRGLYSRNPRGMIQNETGGLLKLVFDAESRRLLGVHVVGAAASEIVHIGQAFHAAGATARAIAETIYNYPTYSDLFRHAALEVAEQAPG
jgi:NAD(P) transhydrogenase